MEEILNKQRWPFRVNFLEENKILMLRRSSYTSHREYNDDDEIFYGVIVRGTIPTGAVSDGIITFNEDEIGVIYDINYNITKKADNGFIYLNRK